MAEVRTSLIVPPSALPDLFDVRDQDRLGPGHPLGHAERPLEDRLRVGGPAHQPGEGARRGEAGHHRPHVLEGLGRLLQQAHAVRHDLPGQLLGRFRPVRRLAEEIDEGVVGIVRSRPASSGPWGEPVVRSVRESSTSSSAMPSPIEWWSRPMSTLPPSL